MALAEPPPRPDDVGVVADSLRAASRLIGIIANWASMPETTGAELRRAIGSIVACADDLERSWG